MKLTPSGSQTVGPFFHLGLEHLCTRDDATAAEDAGLMTIRGRVIDGAGVPVKDAVLEIWHADTNGQFNACEPFANGRTACFTRAATGDDGAFGFTLARPGAIAGDTGQKQAPHVAVLLFARGLMRHLLTRMYFPGEPANAIDPVLQSIPKDRRQTLLARANPDQPGVLEWNVVLQGEDETVFFAW
jgi:protocatechuate 3,4-dioxygenase, alpha subunit